MLVDAGEPDAAAEIDVQMAEMCASWRPLGPSETGPSAAEPSVQVPVPSTDTSKVTDLWKALRSSTGNSRAEDVKLDMEVVETPGGTRFFMKATDSKGATIYDNEPFEKSELLMYKKIPGHHRLLPPYKRREIVIAQRLKPWIACLPVANLACGALAWTVCEYRA